MFGINEAIQNNSLICASISYDRWYDHADECLGWMFSIYTIDSNGNIKKDRLNLDGDIDLKEFKKIKSNNYITSIVSTDAIIFRKDITKKMLASLSNEECDWIDRILKSKEK
jgi:hypothetical protein